jgi:hypothetical protein
MTRTRLFTIAIALTATLGCGGDPNPPGHPTPATCIADPHAAGCAYQVTATATHVYALSSDGFALIVDDAKQGKMIDLAHGAMLTPVTANVTNAFSSGAVIFTFHDGNNQSLHLPVTIWSAASGARELDASAMPFNPPRTDGTHVAWVGNVAADLSTGDIMLGRVDGKKGPLPLVAGISIQGACGWPTVAFVGKRLLVSGCKGLQSQPTLHSYDADTGALVGQVALAHDGYAVDIPGERVLFATSSGGVVASIDLTAATSVASDYKSGKFTPDGNSVIYIDNEGQLRRAPIGAGNAMLLQAGPAANIEAISLNGAWATYSTKTDPNSALTDLYLTSANSAASPAVTLRAATDAILLSDGFTADSRFALFAGNVDAETNGVFSAQAVGGGPARTIANLDFYWFTLDGARVVYTDHLHESRDSNGFADGTADIELVDLGNSGDVPKTLVRQADARMQLTTDKKTIVYAMPSGSATPGIYSMRLP